MTPKNELPKENLRMRALRSVYASQIQATKELKNVRALLAFEKPEGVDIDSLTHAIHLLYAVEEQVVTAYGRLAMERDLPSIKRNQ